MGAFSYLHKKGGKGRCLQGGGVFLPAQKGWERALPSGCVFLPRARDRRKWRGAAAVAVVAMEAMVLLLVAPEGSVEWARVEALGVLMEELVEVVPMEELVGVQAQTSGSR